MRGRWLLAPFGGNAVTLVLIPHTGPDLKANIRSLGCTESLQSISIICIHWCEPVHIDSARLIRRYKWGTSMEERKNAYTRACHRDVRDSLRNWRNRSRSRRLLLLHPRRRFSRWCRRSKQGKCRSRRDTSRRFEAVNHRSNRSCQARERTLSATHNHPCSSVK